MLTAPASTRNSSSRLRAAHGHIPSSAASDSTSSRVPTCSRVDDLLRRRAQRVVGDTAVAIGHVEIQRADGHGQPAEHRQAAVVHADEVEQAHRHGAAQGHQHDQHQHGRDQREAPRGAARAAGVGRAGGARAGSRRWPRPPPLPARARPRRPRPPSPLRARAARPAPAPPRSRRRPAPEPRPGAGRTAVMLSGPPCFRASWTSLRAASSGSGRASCLRMSSSVTTPHRPSLQSSRTSPGARATTSSSMGTYGSVPEGPAQDAAVRMHRRLARA